MNGPDGHRGGVLRALTSTGGVITSAGAVLAATFAAHGLRGNTSLKAGSGSVEATYSWN